MSLFGIFGKREKRLKETIDLSVLHTDVHSHLIPGIDDGSPDMATSMELLKEFERLGYKKIITTPHVKEEVFPNDVNELEQRCEQLRQQARLNGIQMEIAVGAEHLIDDEFHQRLKNNLFKTFSGKHLLIELPFIAPPLGLNDYLFKLQLEGYDLILAHPERYLYWINDFDKFVALKDRGILFQVNIMSFGGYFGKEVRYLARQLADNNMVELLGSDAHGPRHFAAIRDSLFDPVLDRLIKSGNIINKEF